MSYFRVNTNNLNVLDCIGAAYRAAGLTAPSRSAALVEAFGDQPGVDAVAAELVAAAAAGVKDPAKWTATALERLHKAQTADLFRERVLAALPGGELALAADASAQAATDLADHLETVVSLLADAAQHLPTKGDPFDLDHAVATHTTRQREEAQAALGELSVLAGINVTMHPDNGPLTPQMCQILSIVDLPECEVEVTSTRRSIIPQAVNEEDLKGTRAVESLARMAHNEGVDAALLAVVRGRWAKTGMRLALPTPDRLGHRLDQLRTAFSSTPEARHPKRPEPVAATPGKVLG